MPLSDPTNNFVTAVKPARSRVANEALADALAAESESLDGEVRRFLADVQAA